MPHYPDDPLLHIGAQRRLPDVDYSDPDAIFYVTICAAPATIPFSDERLAQTVTDSLTWLRTNRGILIYAYCLMPDHLHLLLRLGSSGWDLGLAVGAMKSFTTRQAWKVQWKGQLWQGQYHDHVLRAPEDATMIAEYIRQNPVRRRLVEDAEEYRWSGFPDPL